MLEGECEFCENWRLVCHILPACLNEILAQFMNFLAVSDEIRYRRSSCIVAEQL